MSNEPIIEIKNRVINIWGEEAWNSLQPETQTGIITSELCYSQFNSYGSSVDFSSSIVPIMRGLERELRDVFLVPYRKYLSEKYTPQEYLSSNSKSFRRNDNPCEKRKFIIQKGKDEIIFFVEGIPEEYTIGNFKNSISSLNCGKIIIDQSFIQYAKCVFFKSYDIQTDDIEKCFGKFIQDLVRLRRLRNDSSHLGKVMSPSDAKFAIEKLIELEKILAKIVDPSIFYNSVIG